MPTTLKWIGGQISRAQINTITVSGTPAAGNVATVTMNSKSITYTVLTGDAIADVATGLVALLNAAVDGEFKLISWTSSAAVITATAATPGVPFTTTGGSTLTVASTGGGATTLTAASVQTNLSPNDVNDTANWSAGALPAAGDTVYVENTDQGMYWNLSALSAITVAVLKFRNTFAPTDRQCWVGNPTIHPDLNFREFRGTELTLQGATVLEVDMSDQAQAGAFRFNVSAASCALKVLGSGGGTIGSEQVSWRGTHATTNAIEVYGGSLVIDPIHFSSSGTAVLQTIKAISAAIRLEAGVTVNTSADIRDTTLDTRVAVPALTLNGEDCAAAVRDAATCTTLIIEAGSVNWISTGTISNLKVGSGGAISFDGGKGAVTVGSGTDTAVLQEASTYIDRNQRTLPFGANYFLLNRCGLAGVTVDFGEHIRLHPVAGA